MSRGPLLFFSDLFAAGVARGTPLLFASTGELLSERSGVLNLGVEGLMLIGAAASFAAAQSTSSLAIGLLAGVLSAALLASLHAVVTVSLGADQVVSGLGLGFLGAGLSSILGAPWVGVGGGPRLPAFEVQGLAELPLIGPALFSQNVIVTAGFLLVPLTWGYLYRTRFGLKLRAVGEAPLAAAAQGIRVQGVRYAHVTLGGALAGLGGASLSLGIMPGWVDGMTAGQGWIAIALVIFAGWDPVRVALGSYLFGAIRRLPLDLQGIESLPLFRNPNLGYFLDMLPYLFTIAVLVLASRGRRRGSFAAPAALGLPFSRSKG